MPLHLLRTCKQQRLSAGIEARAVGEAGARGLIRTPPPRPADGDTASAERQSRVNWAGVFPLSQVLVSRH